MPGFLKRFAEGMGYKQSWVDRMLAKLPTEKIDFFNSKVKVNL